MQFPTVPSSLDTWPCLCPPECTAVSRLLQETWKSAAKLCLKSQVLLSLGMCYSKGLFVESKAGVQSSTP